MVDNSFVVGLGSRRAVDLAGTDQSGGRWTEGKDLRRGALPLLKLLRHPDHGQSQLENIASSPFNLSRHRLQSGLAQVLSVPLSASQAFILSTLDLSQEPFVHRFPHDGQGTAAQFFPAAGEGVSCSDIDPNHLEQQSNHSIWIF